MNISDPTEETSPKNGLSAREILIFEAILNATNVYFDYYGNATNCTNFKDVDATGNLDGAGWNVLACNQLAMPTTNGNNSMFIPNDPFDYNAYTSKKLIIIFH